MRLASGCAEGNFLKSRSYVRGGRCRLPSFRLEAMQNRRKLRASVIIAALLLTAGGATLLGCGMPGAPQPPSLELPEKVSDLTATRTGDQVTLTWTMPKRDTSDESLKGDVTAIICRREGAGSCVEIATVAFAPGDSGRFAEMLPPILAHGDPRPLSYFVDLPNRRGRSAGTSNEATVLAGRAPDEVNGFMAEVRKDGVALRWTPGPAEPYPTLVRLERSLVSTPAAKPTQGLLAAPAEPTKQNLIVPSGGTRGAALDKDIQFGETYEYRAQRITRLTVSGKDLDLDGPLSAPVRIDVKDVFPPAVPIGLAAVAIRGENGSPAAIDLSWQPVSDSDLAGYIVYRRVAATETQSAGEWLRVSPGQPVVGPGFHDATVEAGRSYEYAISSIGLNGRESEKSAIAQEMVPAN